MIISRTKALVSFFFLTYAISRAFWWPEALAARGMLLPAWLGQFLTNPFNPAAFGPLIAALALTLAATGWRGLGAWLRQSLHLRFRARGWLVVLLLPMLIFGGGVLGTVLLGITPLESSVLSNPPYALIGFLVIFFTAGPLQEEPGWRGFALPRLLERHSAVRASVILGIWWWLWHLPLVFIPGKFMTQDPLLFLLVGIEIVLTSILMTWVYLQTHGSVLATMLFHTVMNGSIWMFRPSMTMTLPILALTIVLLALAVGWVVRCGLQPG
ncbi:CPBP family intramembrane glutamic endopeptidase [uncultured Thermanaerothrix sp.]|uniref:CPBP family intramembrane glutamic endopeptidase n=1 Tax=uncultured Thermanaerothrix sp. TaxID=1195149 RepID=UPI00263066A6|nr:CPBP family intramembrane glutamic endopeptidase [uncultured Thermanaerothrix sp.]